MTGVFYGPPSGRLWAGNSARTVTKPSRGPAPALLRSAVREWNELGRAFHGLHGDAVIVRDDPVMALAASRRRPTLGPLILQISHLTPEEVAGHARAGIYGSRAGNLLKARAAQRLRALAIRRAARVLVMTPEMAEALSIEHERVDVIPEGVDAGWAGDITGDEMRSVLSVPRNTPLVAYAGTLNRVRRLEVLVDAFALVVREFPDAILAIAGPGREPEDLTWLQDRARAAGIDRSIRFAGAIPHPRVASLMDAADIVVSPLPNTPVLRCNSPTKLFEAMHRARVVVASDIPEQERVVSASGGGVIVAHESSAYASALSMLLADPDRRARMGGAGRRWVLTNRTYAKLAERVAAISTEVAQARHAGA